MRHDRTVYYDDTAMINCTDTGADVKADVLDFKANVYLNVVIAKNEIRLSYDASHDIYVGNLARLEFTSKGPKRLA